MKQITAMQEQLQQLPEITESQQKALRELQRLHQQVESKKGTQKKLDAQDAQVEDLQKDVAHLTGEKHALTTEIKDLRKATLHGLRLLKISLIFKSVYGILYIWNRFGGIS